MTTVADFVVSDFVTDEVQSSPGDWIPGFVQIMNACYNFGARAF